MYIPETMEDNDFDDVEDKVSQDNTSFPEDFSDRISSSVNEMSTAHGTSLEETIALASLPVVVASLVAEKTSVEVSINLSFSFLCCSIYKCQGGKEGFFWWVQDNISSCQLDAELPKIIVEEDIHDDGQL